ncbi:hypothetical protein [Streptomyces cucumeris]|uniref:hypothetical protein n=1 Tax=Streptomyces cucumeris TaxID=2962890 RepID=UPI003D70932C
MDRWHRTRSIDSGDLRLDGLELLRSATQLDPQGALAVFHFTVRGPNLLSILRSLARRSPVDPDPLTGQFSPEVLLGGVAEPAQLGGPFAIAQPYTVAFLTPDVDHIPALREVTGLPALADQWLWQLASRSSEADFPTTPELIAGVNADAVRISADWSALVLRHGAAFIGHRPDEGPGDFYGFASLHVRSIYLDALLLGTVQRDHIDQLTDDLSGVFDESGLAPRVADLEHSIARFRSTYWRQHLTAHGPANDLLVAYQGQYRLATRFSEILAEAADYSRLVQTQESQQIAGALGVLTILGLPLGTALSILQVLGDDDLGHLLIALGSALAATGAALTTRYGRLVLASLRGGRRL